PKFQFRRRGSFHPCNLIYHLSNPFFDCSVSDPVNGYKNCISVRSYSKAAIASATVKSGEYFTFL
ncbi:MAG: hypothetical protein V7L23_18015, partial [Nostoc sp.]|uniref:hypothetical protein n=1 Tax=Nostoc sp. TaxID=1180 RepID=UPI002FF0309E